MPGGHNPRKRWTLDDLIGVSGQRKQMLLFISHHSRKLDKNAITDADRILWKEPTYAHVLFERDELHDFTLKAFDFFQGLKVTGRDSKLPW